MKRNKIGKISASILIAVLVISVAAVAAVWYFAPVLFPTPTPTPSPTPTSTPTPTVTPTIAPGASPSPSTTITPTPTPSSTPTPSPHALSINIVSINNVTDESGFFHVFGEVENNGTENLESVEIGVNFYGESNSPIPLPPWAHTFLNVIRPGEKSPFEYSVQDPGNIARYEVHVLGAQVTTGQSYREFEILSNSSSVDEFGKFIVVGEMRNIGDEAAESVIVIGTFYNSEGKIVALGHSYSAEAEIQPNQIGTFEMGLTFEELVQEIDHHTLLIEGTQKD